MLQKFRIIYVMKQDKNTESKCNDIYKGQQGGQDHNSAWQSSGHTKYCVWSSGKGVIENVKVKKKI